MVNERIAAAPGIHGAMFGTGQAKLYSQHVKVLSLATLSALSRISAISVPRYANGRHFAPAVGSIVNVLWVR